MDNIDPKVLRQLVATYREHAEAEPRLARIFLEIAEEMEADSHPIKDSEIDHPGQKMRPANRSLVAERIRFAYKLSED